MNKPYSQRPHAEAAKQIRQILKQHFPSCKFSVTSRTYSGGNSVSISWENGPCERKVKDLVAHYEHGHFDPMTDCYYNSNSRDDIPQVSYVITDREITDQVLEKLFEEHKKTHKGWDKLQELSEPSADFQKEWGHWTAYQYLVWDLNSKDLT